MGELEDKDSVPATADTTASPTTPQVISVDEPKETEHLLPSSVETKKDEASSPPAAVAIDVVPTVPSPTSVTVEIEPTTAASVETAKEDVAKPTEVVEPVKTSEAPPKAVGKEGREVKPKKIPIGGIKMPGFFTRPKSKPEGDGADSELLNKETEPQIVAITVPTENGEAKEGGEAKAPQRSFFSALKFRNPFAKRETPTKVDDVDVEQALTEEIKTNGDVDTKEATGAADAAAPEEKPADKPKKGLLNAIRLPICNIIPKKLRPLNGGNVASADDVESGKGPNNKAGLASMETLDDSLKDTENGKDVTDRAAVVAVGEELETVKLNETSNEEKKKEDEANEAKPALSLWQQYRAYTITVDDLAIAAGFIIFLLMVTIIILFSLTGTGIVESAPVRDGKFIEAITSCGAVEGIKEDSAFAFRGIPYAYSPTQDRRFRPAKLIDNIDDCWNGTLKAHTSAPLCWQIFANGTNNGSEDCLKLDVITPHVRYDNPLPVVVLFGSESFLGDSPSKLRPSARYTRARDVIFVRPNFRLNVFGFLSLDLLSKDTYPPTSGNYALSDMIAVLEWIKLNIVHFGGNPKSVTLFGHRAGATLVTALVTSQRAQSLYARAWVTSGAAIFPGKPLAESERDNLAFLERVKCKDVQCLRIVKDEDLLEAIPDNWLRTWPDLPSDDENTTSRHHWLVVDGSILQRSPSDLWNHNINQLKLVVGTTRHEAHSEKLLLKHKEWTPELVRKHVQDSKIGQLGLTDEALSRYNATYAGLVSMISDIRTICPLLTMARAQHMIPFYVVTQVGNGEIPLATVDDDVQAILGRYEPKTPEQRRYVSAIQQLFYHYVSHGEMKQFDTRRPVFDIGQDALSVEDYPNCDYWISKDVVPRYGRLD